MKRIYTTLDEYIYVPDDLVIEGEVEEGRLYTEADFNKIIQIKEREAYKIKLLLNEINQKDKTIVFCANQEHALAIRDLINQYKDSKDPYYCHRVSLEKIAETGFGKEELKTLQTLINAEKSDLFDVLEYVSFAIQPITREKRVNEAKEHIFKGLNEKQREFLDFVLSKYIESGVAELDQR